MSVRKINLFFDRSYQHAIVASPELAITRGVLAIHTIVSATLAHHVMWSDTTSRGGQLRCDFLKSLPENYGDIIVENNTSNFIAALSRCGRVEIVVNLTCRIPSATVRFYEKNSQRNFFIWELVFDLESGRVNHSSLTGHTED